MSTIKQLEGMVERINYLMETPKTPYIKDEKTNELIPQAHNYHLDHGYGGVALHRMGATGTGVDDISNGHFSKKEIHLFLWGFIQALMEIKFTRT